MSKLTVKPKKYLGQHFLKNEAISKKIVDSLFCDIDSNILEIGPGMGVLTKYLIYKCSNFKVVEIDKESIIYLEEKYPNLEIIKGDFLKEDINKLFENKYSIIGNFPYNISSQIVFKVLENIEKIDSVVGMFQKEVAERIASKEGSKVYGILSVLTQAFYDVEYLFTVGENEFNPPPKVKSGVIRLTRKDNNLKNIDKKKLFSIVKMSFNQRRKTLRNSLKSILNDKIKDKEIFSKRPEQLSVNEFINLIDIIL